MGLPAGISVRPWQRDDLAAMAELINERVDDEGVGEFATADVLAEVYDHLRDCDPATDIVVAVDATGAVIGYARAAWYDMVASGVRKYYCAFEARQALPGLDAAMLDWVIARNRDVGRAHAAAGPVPPQQLALYATDGTARWHTAVAAGLTPTGWSAFMSRPLPPGDELAARPLPGGLELRPVEPGHLRAIWEADVDAFRDDRDFFEQTEVDFGRFVAESDSGTELWQVAWDGDRVAGQVRTHETPGESARRGRRRAWTENISTRREWRRRGVATALITASLRQLVALGYEEACLGVDLDNPNDALGLYRSLGYGMLARGAELTAPLFDGVSRPG